MEALQRRADALLSQRQPSRQCIDEAQKLYKTARESYLLDDPKNSTKNIDEQFLHTQFFTLVDRQGRVRGVYDGIKKEEVDQLVTDIKILIME